MNRMDRGGREEGCWLPGIIIEQWKTMCVCVCVCEREREREREGESQSGSEKCERVARYKSSVSFLKVQLPVRIVSSAFAFRGFGYR